MFVTGQALRGKVRNRQVECKGKRQFQQRGIDDIEWYLEKRGSRKILPNFEISDLKCLWWVLNSCSGDFWVLEFCFSFWSKGLGGFFSFFFPFGLLESNFSEFTGTANRTGPVDRDRKTRQWRTFYPRRPRGRSLLFLAPFNEQKCRLVVWVPLQTFRAWPFISGVTSTLETLQGFH